MASPSRAEVDEAIRVAVARSQADMDQRFGYLLGERVSNEQAQAVMSQIVNDARAEFAETSGRIDRLCTGYNAEFTEHKGVIEKIVEEFKVTSASLTQSVDSAREETSLLNEQNKDLRDRLDVKFAE